MPEGTCSIDGCEKPVKGRGWCGMHYWRWQQTGDPLVLRRPWRTLAERLLNYVEVGECWEWQGAVLRSGYGHIRVDGKLTLVHRASYEFHVGAIPDDLWVLHRCDNRSCLRPTHLFLGDAADNCHDMIAKGRKPVLAGEDHPRAKLTEADVRLIRSLKASGVSTADLMARFCMSKPSIDAIAARRSWRHVA